MTGRVRVRDDAGYIEETGDLVRFPPLGSKPPVKCRRRRPQRPSLALWCGRLPSPAPDMLRTLAAKGEQFYRDR
jgi:hypothetical protein